MWLLANRASIFFVATHVLQNITALLRENTWMAPDFTAEYGVVFQLKPFLQSLRLEAMWHLRGHNAVLLQRLSRV